MSDSSSMLAASELCDDLLQSTALTQIIGQSELHPRVVAAARAQAHYLLPAPSDMRLRARAYDRVLEAVLREELAENDLAGTTGYGYHDTAREHYENALARIFRAEAALARISLVSGTHAIMVALAIAARPGTRLLAVTGRPYDTLRNAIADAPGSLVENGVEYGEIALTPAGKLDLPKIAAALAESAAAAAAMSPVQKPLSAIFIQRSRGYAPRASLSIAEVAAVVALVRQHVPQAIIAVDNCYCELVEDREPLEVGADLVMGSLIKNLGGSIAPTGAYIAGRADLIELAATRLYAPGLGSALGPTLGLGRLYFQGLLLAPHVIWESLRGLRFTAAVFAQIGVPVDPLPDAPRRDIVQALCLGDAPTLMRVAQAVQRCLPVNARFRPEPGPVPGYVDPVIMSGGAFVGGATIELSCDAPLRAPYELYFQGGISADHVAIGSLVAADALVRTK